MTNLPDAARSVVVRTVAGAVVASEVSGVGDGDATQVGANSDNHGPLVLLHTLVVVLGVAQVSDGDGLLPEIFVFERKSRNSRKQKKGHFSAKWLKIKQSSAT